MNPKVFPIAAVAATYGMFREGEVGAANGTNTAAPTSTPQPVPVPDAPNDYVIMKEQTFHFKKEKDTIDPENKGPDGKPIVLKKGEKHPSTKMYLPIPKDERLVEFLTNKEVVDDKGTLKYAKEKELINAAVFDVIYSVARGQVNDFREKNPNEKVTLAVLDFNKLDWTAIANMPKSERGAYAPSEEELTAFLDSYAEVMPAATTKSAEAIANHIKLFKDGFKKQRGQKDILELFAGMLAVYLTKAPTDDVEENQQVAEYFVNKLDRWLKTEEKITMDML